MQLIEIILNELTDNKLSLTSPLLKTKLLASRIKNETLYTWANNELSGYKNKEDLPEYRITHGEIVGDYINGNNRISNHTLPIPPTDDAFDQKLRCFEFYEGIESLEKLNLNASENLVMQFPQKLTKVFEDILYEHSNHTGNFTLLSAGVSIPGAFLQSVLNSIRNKLLDFMIVLENEFGLEAKIETLQSNNKKITTIMNTTITNNGDGNLINTGDNSNITATFTVNKGDQNLLRKDLESHNVDHEDIDQLLKIIDTEVPVSKDSFGDKVNKWIYTMMGKAMDGSWKVGIGAAGGLLARAIANYYGIN